MLRGIVRWFNSKKQHGFIVLEGSEEEIYFRFRSGGQIVSQSGLAMISDDLQGLRQPQPDDRLVLEIRNTRKGREAKHWGYAAAYDAVVETLPEVRVVMAATLRRRGECLKLKPGPIWQGKDLREADEHLTSLSHPLRPGHHRTGEASTQFFRCQNRANYRLEVLTGGRWKRYEKALRSGITDSNSALTAA